MTQRIDNLIKVLDSVVSQYTDVDINTYACIEQWLLDTGVDPDTAFNMSKEFGEIITYWYQYEVGIITKKQFYERYGEI